MASLSSSALFVVFCLCFEYGIGTKNNGIKWPNKYHIKYEALDVINGVVRDVSLWYAAAYQMSREDFNGDTVRSYYENHTKYTLLPELRNNTPVIKCLKSHYSSLLSLLSLLFDDNYKLSGNETFDGKEVLVWKMKLPHVKKTLYIYQRNGYDIPFRLISKTFDKTTARMTEHLIVNFYYYSGRVTKQDMSIDVYLRSGKASCELSSDNEESPETSFDLDSVFETYKKQHNKNYTNTLEHMKRREIFHKNLRKVMEHNSQNLSYRMGLNQFSDMTSEERRRFNSVSTSDPSDRGTYFLSSKVEDLQKLSSEFPEEMDLRLKGVVTPVKNQQLNCESSWAFATAAAVEGAIALKNGGRLLRLSEQCLIDCTWGYGCNGCKGGRLGGSFRYAYDIGLPTEANYGTYEAQEGTCHAVTELFKIKGYGRINARSELALKVALNRYGPVATLIRGTNKLYKYKHGVFYDLECDSATPKSIIAVTVVGYGVRDGETYWIVKNSWGSTWGQDGYILMAANNNNCFVQNEGYFAVS